MGTNGIARINLEDARESGVHIAPPRVTFLRLGLAVSLTLPNTTKPAQHDQTCPHAVRSRAGANQSACTPSAGGREVLADCRESTSLRVCAFLVALRVIRARFVPRRKIYTATTVSTQNWAKKSQIVCAEFGATMWSPLYSHQVTG